MNGVEMTNLVVNGVPMDNVYVNGALVFSAGWNLANAVYDNISGSVNPPSGGSTDIYFKPDGTKLYIIDGNNDTVYQYSLPTPWSLATLTYDNKLLNVNAQAPGPTGIYFKSDGTSMYIVGGSTNMIYQYTMSIAWDVSTSSLFSSAALVVATGEFGNGVYFSQDGLRMYVVNYKSFFGNTASVSQYSLSTAWNISTTNFIALLDITSPDSRPEGIFFKPDGTKMYIAGSGGGAVYQHTLLTPWVISTSTYDTISFSISPQEQGLSGLSFHTNGKKMYIIGFVQDAVFQYSL